MTGRALSTAAVSPPGEAGAGLTVRLFGPVEVRVGGEPLRSLHSRKGLWLLALLALRAGRDVEREWLAGVLWLDSDATHARRNLRQSLSDLRLALGPEAARLAAQGARTVRFVLEGAFVDALAFDAALARGDAESLAEAVSLYRGPLLEGCVEEWCLPERQQREQAYLGALAALAIAATARGEPPKATEYLRTALAMDPFREDLQRGLMGAMAAAGNPTAALLVYREYRELLRGEMGAEPAEETTTLFRRLREETRAGSSRQEPGGRRQAAEGQAAGGRRQAARLPVPLTELIGREAAGREVAVLLAPARSWNSEPGSRLVTLTGAGGIGKTRLALQVATELAEEFLDGVRFVELAALSDGALVPDTVAGALGIAEPAATHPAGAPPAVESLCEALRECELLLALDNCEHLVPACAELADQLLGRCPRLRILATSRQPLGLVGEVAWRVPSLAAPGSPPPPAGVKDALAYFFEFDALRLFVARAQQANPGFRLTPADAATVAQICRRLDGIPLAIELAAARVRAMPAAAIAARLDDRFQLLTGGSRTALPRQQTLRGALDWSYDLLTEEERALMRRLSVFAGGWTLEAAEEVCGGEGVYEDQSGLTPGPSPQTAWRGVTESTSLPGCTETGGRVAPRSETRTSGESSVTPLHAVCGEWPGVRPAAQSAHTGVRMDAIRTEEVLDLLTALVDRSLVVYEERGDGGGSRYRFFETVRQYASERLAEAGEKELARGRHLEFFLGLAEAAEPHLTGAGQAEWLDRLAAEHDNLRAALDWSLTGIADCGLWIPDLPDAGLGAPRGPDQSAIRPPDTRVPAQSAIGLRLAGALWRFWLLRGHLTEGRERLRQALAQATEPRATRAKAILAAGSLAFRQADYPIGRSLAEESLAIRRELGDSSGIADSLTCLGMIAFAQDDFAVARLFYQESLAIRRELGDRWGIAASLNNLGTVAYIRKDYATAGPLYEESLAIQQQVEDRSGIATSLSNLGMLAFSQGEFAAARIHYEESLAIRRQLGDRLGIATSLHLLGAIVRKEGDTSMARILSEEGLAIRRDLGERWGIAGLLEQLGHIACETHPDPSGRDQGGVAAIALPPAAARRAARLFGAAEALREAIGTLVVPDEPDAYRRHLTRVREVLGEQALAATLAEGRAMSLEEAIADALDWAAVGLYQDQ